MARGEAALASPGFGPGGLDAAALVAAALRWAGRGRGAARVWAVGRSMIPGRAGVTILPGRFGFTGGRGLPAVRDLAAALSFSGWRTFGFGLAQPAL